MKIIISDEELKSRMKLPLPELVKGPSGSVEMSIPIIERAPELGRGEGNNNIDPLTKELIAIDGAFVPFSNKTQNDVARIHGVKQSEVSYLSRGYDRSNVDERKVDEDLHTSINKTKFGIIDVATTKLMETLDLFEPSALEQKHLPDAAVKMASVVERLEGRGNISNAPNVQFHLYAPRARREEDYEVIEVHE